MDSAQASPDPARVFSRYGAALIDVFAKDLALAWAAVPRVVLWLALALGLLGIAVLLATALSVAVLVSWGLGWPAALLLTLLVVLAVSASCLLLARRTLRDCQLVSSRRQLRRFGALHTASPS